MDLIYPWTAWCQAEGWAPMPGSLQGRSTGVWARVPLAAAGGLLSAISLVLDRWSGAQRERQGHHSGRRDRPRSASTYMDEGGTSQRHQDVLRATRGHGRQGRGQDLGAVLRVLQTKHRRGSNRMLQSPHPQHTVLPPQGASSLHSSRRLQPHFLDEKTEGAEAKGSV